MLTFNKLILHNFGSYSHAEVDLKEKGFCMVSGRNYCKKDNAYSNGSGKSILWSGICFAITGETINGLHSNLKNINIDEDLAYVALDFSADTDNYIITRYIEPKSDMKIIRNGEDVSGKGIRESEKKLGEYLPDLNRDLLASTIILGQGLPNKFTSFSPVGRKELLEKLTKSDFMIEDMKARIAKRIDELNKKLREYEDSLLVNTTQLNNTNSLITKAETELTNIKKPDYADQITKLKVQIAADQDKLEKTNTEISNLEIAVDTANDKLLKINSEKSNNITLELAGYTKKYQEEYTKQTEIEANIKSISTEITKLKNITDICPTCGQKIPGVQKPSTTKLEETLTALTASLTAQKDAIKAIEQRHNDNQKMIEDSFKVEIATANNELAMVKNNLNSVKSNKVLLEGTINNNSTALTKLIYDTENYDRAVQKLKDEIAELAKAKEKYEKLIALTDDSKKASNEHLSVVKKLDSLSKREYRGYILTNIINHLNAKAKEYSKLVFGTEEFEIYLDGNALDISYGGKLVESLSGGERTRIDLILQFAIRDLLSSHLNLTSNILVLDEITDFLDATSCAAVMQLIENELNTVESVFIISHHAESLNLSFDSEIKVIKNTEGISEVYQ